MLDRLTRINIYVLSQLKALVIGCALFILVSYVAWFGVKSHPSANGFPRPNRYQASRILFALFWR